ncbi:MAG: YCF48-related protein [Acidobacteriota bacterium]
MKKFYTLFLLIMISAMSNAQTYNWEWQNPKPHGNDVNDIKYLGSGKLIAVAGAGVVQKSIDGGSKWDLIKADTLSRDILSVYFRDENNGMLCGNAGLIMQTKDAGKTWSYIDSKVTEDLYDVKFMDSDTGYVVGTKGTVLKTKDGGKNWTLLTAGTSTNYKVFILNAKNLFIASGTTDNKLMKSNDYGKTWTNTAPAGLKNNVYSVTFTDSVTGFIGTSNNDIYKTVDGGTTWTKKGGAATSINISGIKFTDKARGYAVDVKGNVFVSADSGNTWTSAKIPLQKFNAIDGDTSVLYVAGAAGSVLRSDDKGKTWTSKTSAIVQSFLREVKFVDEKTGYACGGSATPADSLGYILKTTDGGANWTFLSKDFKSQVYTFSIVTPTLWCAAGSGNGLYRSTDAGLNWTKITSPVTTASMVFYSMGFAGKDTGYAAGNTGNVIKTVDGGQTWTKLTTNAGTSTIWEVAVLNTKTVLFSAIQGKMSRTTDGGTTWEALAPNVAGSLSALCFKDDSTGYVGGGNKGLARTTDGGKTWTVLQLPSSILSTATVWGIAFGKDKDWLITSQGDVCSSSDSGKTWQIAQALTTMDLYNVATVGDDVWAVGNNGIIIHGKPAKIDAVEDEKSAVARDFVLSQNYPNPFNPSTVIRYSIPSEAMVSLKVYNVMGKEVARLVNENQARGTYSVKFDASRLSSGIYFYELRAGRQIVTKKMLLIK